MLELIISDDEEGADFGGGRPHRRRGLKRPSTTGRAPSPRVAITNVSKVKRPPPFGPPVYKVAELGPGSLAVSAPARC